MKGKQLIHKTQIDRKINLTLKMLTDHLDIFRGLVMMAYPGYYGLGDYEPIRVILENKELWDEKMNLSEDLAYNNTTLWIVSKECQP